MVVGMMQHWSVEIQTTDIAVIKIERDQEFPMLTLGDSKNVRVGQFAIAIGDPIGFRQTVTAGIIGGKDRCHHPKSKTLSIS